MKKADLDTLERGLNAVLLKPVKQEVTMLFCMDSRKSVGFRKKNPTLSYTLCSLYPAGL